MTCTCEYKNNTTTTNSNVCTPHSPTAICVDLWSNVYHAGGWNCSKSMHKSKWTYILVFSNLGNTSKRTNSKYGIWVQYYGHASSGQWTLTTPRKGIWTPVLKIQIHKWLFFNLYMCIYLNPRATSIPWSKFRIRIFTSYPYSITSTLQPLDLLKICSNDDFLFPHLHYEIGLYRAVVDQKQLFIIVDSNALDIKGGMESPSSLECTPQQWRVTGFG